MAWIVIGAGALVISVSIHVRHPLARTATRELVNGFVSNEVRGELRIGRIDVLETDRVVARHVEVFDPYGTRVASAREVVLVPDLDAALGGTLRFSSARLRHGWIRLITDP